MNFNKLSMVSIIALSLVASAAFADKHDDDKKNEKCCKRIAVTTTRDSGKGSLRWAIEKANLRNRAEGAHIVFKLEKSDCGYNRDTKTWVICPETDLPEITAPRVKILGLSQCGSEENCEPIDQPSNDRYRVELCGPGLDEEAAVSAQALIFPRTAIRFALPAVEGEISGFFIHGFPDAGVVTAAPSTTVRALNLSQNPTGALRQNLTDVVFTETAHNGVFGGVNNADLIQAAGRGRLAVVPNAKAALFLDGRTLGGSLTLQSVGLRAQNIKANLNRVGDAPVNVGAQVGIVVDNQAPAAAEDEIDGTFTAVRSAAHRFANFSGEAFSQVVLNDVAVGTTANTTLPTAGNAGDGFAFRQRTLPLGKAAVFVKAGIIDARNIIARGNLLRGIALGLDTDAPLRSFTATGVTVSDNGVGLQTRNLLQGSVQDAVFTRNVLIAADVEEATLEANLEGKAAAIFVPNIQFRSTQLLDELNLGGVAFRTQIPVTIANSTLSAPTAIVLRRPVLGTTLPLIAQPVPNTVRGDVRLQGFLV